MKETFKLSRQTSIHDPMVLNSTVCASTNHPCSIHTHLFPFSITDSSGEVMISVRPRWL